MKDDLITRILNATSDGQTLTFRTDPTTRALVCTLITNSFEPGMFSVSEYVALREIAQSADAQAKVVAIIKVLQHETEKGDRT